LFGHHHGAHRSVLKHYDRQLPGNDFGTVQEGGLVGAASMPKSSVRAIRVKPHSFRGAVSDCNTRTVYAVIGWKTVAIRRRGLGFWKYVWFNPTMAIKSL